MDRPSLFPGWVAVAATSALLTLGLALAPQLQRPAHAAALDAVDLAPSRRLIDVEVAPQATGDINADPSHPYRTLFPLHVVNLNTREAKDIRLYAPGGSVDEGAACNIDALLADARDPEHPRAAELDRRLLQLLYRAAYHFRAREVEVISGYRQPGRQGEGGQHALGGALDFKLKGVPAPVLAEYLRRGSRVGVGLYTHPKTQWVHLDVRARSYHWVDGSGPGRRSAERPLSLAGLAARDSRYDRTSDWPEGF